MRLKVIIEYDNETKSYSAVCPRLPGCVSCGDSEKEAFENMKEAIALYLEEDETLETRPNAKVYEVNV